MDIIEDIKRKLLKYPSVEYIVNENSITILPISESGFEISVFAGSETFSVFFEGWHGEFEDAESALDCLAFGLSTECRLKVGSRGCRPYKWTVEFREDQKWKVESTTALLIFPFWRKKTEQFLQNDLID